MLESYEEKRDFTATPEPAPGDVGPRRGALRFVVQEHAARRLHYDFRLEADGVLKSWPVPRGPSLDPDEKRLAVMVEDHPTDYGTFEGVIPKGEYGAGQVIVWDAGVYSPDEGGLVPFGDREAAEAQMRKGLEDGKLSFTLRGRKLRGSWTLVRTTSRGPNEWLLIKHNDGYADPSRDVLEEDRSVLSGLTIADLKAGRLPDPGSGALSGDGGGREAPFPTSLKPMMAHTAEDAFTHRDWLFEPKLDGFRAIAFIRDGQVTLKSRTGKDMTDNFPEVVSDLIAQPEHELVLDGELVALDENGKPSFALMQQVAGLPHMSKGNANTGQPHIMFYPFDLIHSNGRDLRRVPLSDRKVLLGQTLIPGDHVQPMEYVEEQGKAFFQVSKGLGLEGIVAKRRASAYEPGARSRSWVKIKHIEQQEFVVAGYTEGEGARSAHFGALVLGYYDGDTLKYAGRAGSGFDDRSLEQILPILDERRSDEIPFGEEPDLEGKRVSWLRPELVAQVKFSEWTHDNILRAPVFLGLRDDVDPRSVVRETSDATLAPIETTGPDRDEQPADIVADVLEQLSGEDEQLILEVGEHRISVTNLNKVLWPEEPVGRSITKREMIEYYARIGALLVPHLRDRPLTLTRYPNGIYADSFYQKNWQHALPEFVETVRLFSSHNEGDVEYVMVNNLPTLIWLAQLADLEMHPWMSRSVLGADAEHLTTSFTGSEEAMHGSALNYPDFIIFDLDPYIYSGEEKKGDEPELNRRAFSMGAEIALELKEVLDELSLSSFLKTSGKTGLHIYIPIQRHYHFGLTRKTCELIGRFLLQRRPRDVTMEWTVDKRAGKIFLDHNQNVRGKNMASIYSLRPLPGAPVSTPLAWDELENVYPTDFNIDTVPERVDRIGDLWASVLDAKHDLRRVLESAEA